MFHVKNKMVLPFYQVVQEDQSDQVIQYLPANRYTDGVLFCSVFGGEGLDSEVFSYLQMGIFQYME